MWETGTANGDLCGHHIQMNKAKLPTHVELEAGRFQLVKDSVILLEQLRTIDKKRLKDRVCHLDGEILDQVDKAHESQSGTHYLNMLFWTAFL